MGISMQTNSKKSENSVGQNERDDAPGRLSFPDDEKAHPYLTMLLNAYHIVDEGVSEGILKMENQGRALACKKGCSACCTTHKNIPVYPLELVGISWFATEKVGRPGRKKLIKQLKDYKNSNSCPFLLDGVCSVHPLRPMACRQFNVFDKICAEGEDAYQTRRKDVLTPIKKYADRAFNAMLPFYGAKSRAERRRVIKTGAVHIMAREMNSFNWESLAKKMEEYER